MLSRCLRSGSQPDDEHRAWRRPDDCFGSAAERQPRKAGAAVRTDDDELGAYGICEIDDSLCRRSRFRDRLTLDREFRQRFSKSVLSRSLKIVDRSK